MAIGTATVVEVLSAAFQNLSIVEVSFAGDGAYPTGGTATFSKVATILSALGGKRPIAILSQGLNGGYELVYDAANDKLLAVVKSSGVEVTNATDLSGTTFKAAILCV